jgi:acyl dehydratase
MTALFLPLPGNLTAAALVDGRYCTDSQGVGEKYLELAQADSGMHYFEDLEEGDRFDLGSVTVERDGMIDFAEKYDPQYFHTDPEVAEDSMFGGLVASGLYTHCLFNRLLINDFMSQIDNMGGNKAELEWHAPLYPDSTITGYVEIAETRQSSSRDDRGYIHIESTVETEEGKHLMTIQSRLIVGRK